MPGPGKETRSDQDSRGGHGPGRSRDTGGGRGGRYHHGDLRAALIDTAIDLIGERGGIRGFSMAEASRRLGVAVSAPYAHFADRDDLLAAVAVHAFGLLHDALAPEMESADPGDRLAAMTRGYVRFAAAHRALFEMLYDPAGPDKARHPEIETAERPVTDAFLACGRELCSDDSLAEELACSLEASAYGHAAQLLSDGAEAAEGVAERAARATRALVASRRLLGRPSQDKG